MITLKYRPLFVLLLFVIVFSTFSLLACDDGPHCDPAGKCDVTQPLDNVIHEVEKQVDNTCTPENSWSGTCNVLP